MGSLMQTETTRSEDFQRIGVELRDLLNLENPPIAISFIDSPPEGLKKNSEVAPSGCVFWIRAFKDSFYTVPEDHFNCNIGTVTHGFKKPSELDLASCVDINLMVGAEYIPPEALDMIPKMNERPKYVAYGPLDSATFEPDVVLLVCNPQQAMLIAEAAGSYKTLGLPTCSAIPNAYNTNEVSISFGCVTNRVRTGIKPSELVVTIPKAQLGEFVKRLKPRVEANNKVAQAVTAMLHS